MFKILEKINNDKVFNEIIYNIKINNNVLQMKN